MAQQAQQPRHHTYADYLTWGADRRWEIIDGRARAMSPAPSREHQRVLGELYFQIRGFSQDRSCHAYLAPFDVRLPDGDQQDADLCTVVGHRVFAARRGRVRTAHGARDARSACEWLVSRAGDRLGRDRRVEARTRAW